jgi:hypothetical protein
VQKEVLLSEILGHVKVDSGWLFSALETLIKVWSQTVEEDNLMNSLSLLSPGSGW